MAGCVPAQGCADVCIRSRFLCSNAITTMGGGRRLGAWSSSRAMSSAAALPAARPAACGDGAKAGCQPRSCCSPACPPGRPLCFLLPSVNFILLPARRVHRLLACFHLCAPFCPLFVELDSPLVQVQHSAHSIASRASRGCLAVMWGITSIHGGVEWGQVQRGHQGGLVGALEATLGPRQIVKLRM